MQLCSFLAGDAAGQVAGAPPGAQRPAVVSGPGTLVDLTAADPPLPADLGGLLAEERAGRLAALATSAPETARVRLEEVRLAAPVPRPSKIIGIGLNYRDHAAETGQELPARPTVFAKFPTRVNGVTVQHSNTANMVFSVPALISLLSEAMTLEPGDIIATGTPGGVGGAQNPPRFLKDGDVVEVEIERLGCLRNPVVAGAEERSW